MGANSAMQYNKIQLYLNLQIEYNVKFQRNTHILLGRTTSWDEF